MSSGGHSNHNVTVSRPGVLNVFADSGLLHGTANKQTKTQGGEHGILAPALEGKPTQNDITRRLAFLTKRQMEYDAYNKEWQHQWMTFSIHTRIFYLSTSFFEIL